MKKIFLTGGNGFIGKNFSEHLSELFHVASPVRKTLELSDENAVSNFFSDKKFDCIVHGANIGGTRKAVYPEFYCLNQNIRAFVNLFREFEYNNAAPKFIQLGSGAEYGRPLFKSKINEAELGKHIPSDEYGLSKYVASKMIEAQHPFRAISLHLFAIFGPYEDYQMRFISNAIVRTLFNLPILIHQDVVFDYLYVKDCVKIIQQFIEKPAQFSRYNIGSGSAFRLSEIAEIIISVLGAQNDIIITNKTLNAEYSCNIDKLKDFLGKEYIFTPIETAIKELASFYEKQLDSLNREWIINPC